MFTRTIALTAVVAAVALLAPASTQATTSLSRINHLTFSGAVRVPGAVLAPGTYTFEAGPQGTDLNLVRVSTRDGRRTLFLGFTVPVSGQGSGPIVSLGEAPAGSPPPIMVWYESGATRGHEFRY